MSGSFNWPRLFAALIVIAFCGLFWWLVLGSFRSRGILATG